MKNRSCYQFSSSVLALAVSVLWTSSVSARLGESPGQSAKRYGKPLKTSGNVSQILSGTDQEVYHFQGWQIVAAFHGSETVRIEYSKLRDYADHESIVVQPDDIAALLEGEKGAGEWKEIEKEPTSNPFKAFTRSLDNMTTWTNAATGCAAQLRLNKMNMTFISPSAADAGKGKSSKPKF